jgi:hypothetical protein
MAPLVAEFWAALGRLTFAETVTVSETMRDAWENTNEFEPTDIQEWAFLLNTAREIAQDRIVDEHEEQGA